MSTDIIIPAHDEGESISSVLSAITQSDSIGRVIVVADSCSDDTIERAMEYTSSVMPIHAQDKGTAMSVGLDYVTSPYVAFCDGDLYGLRSDHITRLCSKDAAQVAGVFSWNNLRVPPITGQRCVPTWLARKANLANHGWEAETRINALVGRYGLSWKHFHLDGVEHESKLAGHDPSGWFNTMQHVGMASIKYGGDLLNYVLYPEGRKMKHLPREMALK
jgi:glycosyltransferase involved in cell wall biosynthesis